MTHPGSPMDAGILPLPIIGIGEDGWDGLGSNAQLLLLAAATILGSQRQLDLLPPEVRGVREAWPSPMAPRVRALAAEVSAGAAYGTVVLASGDPMLHGVGATLVGLVDPALLRVMPAPSAFALACARLGWPQPGTPLVSRVADPETPVASELRRAGRVIVYVAGAEGSRTLASDLRAEGLGAARLVVLERLGGEAERAIESTAGEWDALADPLHLVALELPDGSPEPTGRPARLSSRVPGLPDEFYGGDGQLTRAEIRAVALAALAPCDGERLWDVGAGSGTIAVEWCRAASAATAIAIEVRPDRANAIRGNAIALGAGGVTVLVGAAPVALDGLPQPDAIFIGGSTATPGLIETCWAALPVGGRLVANAVTLEGEQALSAAFEAFGGRLLRLDVAHAEPLGSFTGWKPQRPVVQWSSTKR